jgi:hypothetical protein
MMFGLYATQWYLFENKLPPVFDTGTPISDQVKSSKQFDLLFFDKQDLFVGLC